MTQLAFGAGIASAVLWVIAVMFFTGPGVRRRQTREPRDVVPSTFRALNDTGYLAWVGATVIGALTVWAASAVAIRAGFLPRWFGWIGVVVGVIQLLAFFIPAFVFWLWILITGVLLVMRHPARTERHATT